MFKQLISVLADAVKARLYAVPYALDIQPSGAFDFLLMRTLPGKRLAFAFRKLAASPVYETLAQARSEARGLTRAMWLWREVGLYLMLCGSESLWRDHTHQAPADRTGLHHVIIQAVHFVDPQTGATHLNQSAWGSIHFGGVDLLAALVNEVVSKGRPNGV